MKQRQRKLRTDAEGRLLTQTLGSSAIEAYVSAIMEIWKMQHSLRQNPATPVRSFALKQLLHKWKTAEAARRRDEYADRGTGTLINGYSEDEFVQCIQGCWRPESFRTEFLAGDKRKRSGLTAQQYSGWLRTAVDLLFTHNMLLRGETVRNGELPDLFTAQLKNKGVTDCRVLCMIIDNGKTNLYRKLEYGVAVRHRELWKCLLSQLAFYLFFRWHVEREAPPSFRQRADWYRTKILKGGLNTSPLSYQTQLLWVNDIFQRCDISLYKKTHAGQKQGAQHAELLGVSESQIQRAG